MPKIRKRVFATSEILYQRDHFSGKQFYFNDVEVSTLQIRSSTDKCRASKNFKARCGPPADVAPVPLGTLIYIKNIEVRITNGIDRYLFTKMNEQYCKIKK